MRETLHEDENLAVFLTIEDDDVMRLVIESRDPQAFDLSVEDEVIVVMQGRGVDVAAESAERAVARLGPAEDLADRSFQVMVRVYDFFEGWDFGAE